MDKIDYINDLIEGVDLNSSTATLASSYIPAFSKVDKKDVIPVIMKPSKTQSGDVHYNVYVDNYHQAEEEWIPDENKLESFTEYENSMNYTPYKNEQDFMTQFYVASLTVVGLYIFFRLVQSGR